MTNLCETCGYHFVSNHPEATMCYECFLTARPPKVPCYHPAGCFLNKDGLVECPCGAIIYEEMGS